MDDTDKDSNHVECGTHGRAYAAYICGHLAWNPMQRWYGYPPTEDDPWPDAWCAKCEEALQTAGDWNEENETAVDIKLLCSHCYESARAKSIESLKGEALAKWEGFLGQCWDELQAKQARLAEEYKFGGHERYDWNQQTGELVFSNAGVPALVCTIQFVGSTSTLSDTWLWSWANFHLQESVRLEMDKVRAFGEENGFPRLTVPMWNANEQDGWEMAAVATHVLGALGVYRSPGENGALFMIVTGIRDAAQSVKVRKE